MQTAPVRWVAHLPSQLYPRLNLCVICVFKIHGCIFSSYTRQIVRSEVRIYAVTPVLALFFFPNVLLQCLSL